MKNPLFHSCTTSALPSLVCFFRRPFTLWFQYRDIDCPLCDLKCYIRWTSTLILCFQTDTRRLTPSSRWWFPGWSPSVSSSRWPCSPPLVSSSPASSSASTSSTDIPSKCPFFMYTVSRYPTCNKSRFERTSGSASRFLGTEIIGPIIKGSVTRWRKSTQFRRICLLKLDSKLLPRIRSPNIHTII